MECVPTCKSLSFDCLVVGLLAWIAVSGFLGEGFIPCVPGWGWGLLLGSNSDDVLAMVPSSSWDSSRCMMASGLDVCFSRLLVISPLYSGRDATEWTCSSAVS